MYWPSKTYTPVPRRGWGSFDSPASNGYESSVCILGSIGHEPAANRASNGRGQTYNGLWMVAHPMPAAQSASFQCPVHYLALERLCTESEGAPPAVRSRCIPRSGGRPTTRTVSRRVGSECPQVHPNPSRSCARSPEDSLALNRWWPVRRAPRVHEWANMRLRVHHRRQPG